jgi:hypothetical protein
MFQTKVVERLKHTLITFFPENRAVYEIMWENTVQPDRLQITNRTHVLSILDT